MAEKSYNVVWTRYRDRQDDMRFETMDRAERYIAECVGKETSELRYTPSLFPGEKDMIVDYYGAVIACIIEEDED